MGILTRPLLRPQQRWDLEDFNTALSALRTDSHFYTKRFVADKSYILQGFTISQAFIGQPTADVTLTEATLINGDNTGDTSWWTAPESPAPLTLPTGVGGLQAGRNYVELEVYSEDGTPLQRAFWDPSANSGTGVEFTQEVDTVTEMFVRTQINQTGFTVGNPNRIRLAVIDLDNSLNIRGIKDKRNLLFRLGEPDDIDNVFPWGSRSEPTSLLTFVTPAGTAFTAGETITFSSGATAVVVVGGTNNIQVYDFSTDSSVPGDLVTGGSSGATATLQSYYESFTGADKDIRNYREMFTALANEIRVVKGTRFWYEAGSALSLPSVLNYVNTILAPYSAGARFSWSGSSLTITDDAVSGQATSDPLAAIRTPGFSNDLFLTRQDGTGGSAALSIPNKSILYVELPASGDRSFSESGTGVTNYRVVDIGDFVPTDRNFILAYREGSKIILTGLGELEAGETVEVGDSVSNELLAFIGSDSETSTTPQYPTVPNADLGSQFTTADSLTVAIGVNAANANQLATAALKQLEDRNVLLTGGGTLTYDGTANNFAFSQALKLEFNSLVGGGAPVVVDLGATTRAFSADGRMLYAVVNRTLGTATVTADAATLPAQTLSNQEVFLIAKRRDVAGVKTIYFRNGTVIEQDQSTTLDSTIASGIDVDSALPLLGTAQDAKLMSVLTSIDGSLAKLFENSNVQLADGGQLALNNAGTSLTISENLKLHVNSLVAGGAPSVIDLGAGPFAFSASGRMLYAVIDRIAATATVTADATALPAVVAANVEVVLIAKRIDSPAGVKTVYLRDGTSVVADASTRLGRPTASNIEAPSALPLVGTASNATAMAALSGIDSDLARLYEDRNVVLAGGGFVTYLGTTVQFTEALELHLNSRVAGGSPVVVSLGSTTRTISATGRMIYAVVDRALGTATVTADAASLPPVVAANKEVFLIAKRIDAGAGVKRLYFRNGSAFNEGQSARLGSAGSGSGGGNPILESLKNQFVDSPYELITPNIIVTDSDSKFSSLTGAALDIVNNVVQFTANGQQATSIQMLDATEFLSRALDVGEVDLTAFWNRGTTLQAFAVPTAFTYEVSRDGGTNWFPVSMSQLGATDTLRGSLRFDLSTTTEAIKQTLVSQTNQTGTRALNATTVQALSQSFLLASTTAIQNVDLYITKAGAPAGSIYVTLVRDSSGLPSTSSADVVSQSNAIALSGLSNGANTVSLPTSILAAGTYHLVVTSDIAYKALYNAVTSGLEFQVSTASDGESSYNGTIWTDVGAEGFRWVLRGRALDLRVRITSAGSPTYPCGLDGFGVFYSLQDVGVVSGVRKNQRFVFNSVTDNLNSFAITAFNADPDLLKCYWIEGGKVYKSPAFELQGNTAVFPVNTFNNGGISATMTLIFDQNAGSSFDRAETNARLLATNHLGSPDGVDDRSVAGRGIYLRRPDGTLRELVINDNDEIEIYSV